MAEEFITRNEHEEFAKRIEETNKRQNRRIDELEESVKDINRLATSIEKIAVNQEYMIKEQAKQNTLLEKAQTKIEAIEKQPLEALGSAKKRAVETVVSVVVTAIVVALIVLAAQNI